MVDHSCYNHPALNLAAKAQIDKMSHVMFGGITHQPAVDLCKKLVDMTPEPLQHVFLADSGSVAVEVSLKMALQYWHAKGERRPKFLTIKHGYHGDTFAAMSVTDPNNSMHSLYKGFLPEHIFAQSPECRFDAEWREDDISDFKQKLESNQNDIAAVIIEPIVQGAGGMRIYHPPLSLSVYVNYATSQVSCSSPMKLPPASVVPANCLPASTPGSAQILCVSARR